MHAYTQHELGVNETLSEAGVNQSLEGMVRDGIRDERNYEGVIQKSRHIEFDLVIFTEGVNTVLYACRGRTAVCSFKPMASVVLDFSLVLVAQALAFEEEDVDFGHSQLCDHLHTEEAEIAVHSLLSFLLGQLAVLSKFGREVCWIIEDKLLSAYMRRTDGSS